MKKEDLTAITSRLRKSLHSDAIFVSINGFQNSASATQPGFLAVKDNILTWIVEGVASFARFDERERDVANALKLDGLYSSGSYQSWITHWTEFVKENIGHGHAFVQREASVRFIEAHRRLICLDELLRNFLKTDRGSDELIVEGLVGTSEPPITELENTLKILRELAKTYCEYAFPEEEPTVRVTYLDMGSNYQVGIKVDGKGEIGPNLNKFLSQIFKFIANPRAYIRQLNVETVTKEVDVFAEIQARVTKGEISAEAGQVFVQRLFGGAQKLAEQKVFPASLLKQREETEPVKQLLGLMEHHPVHKELTAPTLLITPPTTSEDVATSK